MAQRPCVLVVEEEPAIVTLRQQAAHPRQAFSRAHLVARPRGAYGDESSITTHAHRVRESSEDGPTDPRSTVTIWAVGDRFEGVCR
jgi:DNA-binding response OmpR family regulator